MKYSVSEIRRVIALEKGPQLTQCIEHRCVQNLEFTFCMIFYHKVVHVLIEMVEIIKLELGFNAQWMQLLVQVL